MKIIIEIEDYETNPEHYDPGLKTHEQRLQEDIEALNEGGFTVDEFLADKTWKAKVVN